MSLPKQLTVCFKSFSKFSLTLPMGEHKQNQIFQCCLSLLILVWTNVCDSWRYPSDKSVKDLIFKKGYTIIEGNPVPLTDNNIIEQVISSFLFKVYKSLLQIMTMLFCNVGSRRTWNLLHRRPCEWDIKGRCSFQRSYEILGTIETQQAWGWCLAWEETGFQWWWRYWKPWRQDQRSHHQNELEEACYLLCFPLKEKKKICVRPLEKR